MSIASMALNHGFVDTAINLHSYSKDLFLVTVTVVWGQKKDIEILKEPTFPRLVPILEFQSWQRNAFALMSTSSMSWALSCVRVWSKGGIVFIEAESPLLKLKTTLAHLEFNSDSFLGHIFFAAEEKLSSSHEKKGNFGYSRSCKKKRNLKKLRKKKGSWTPISPQSYSRDPPFSKWDGAHSQRAKKFIRKSPFLS